MSLCPCPYHVPYPCQCRYFLAFSYVTIRISFLPLDNSTRHPPTNITQPIIIKVISLSPLKKKNHQFNITYNWSKFSLFLSLSAFRYGPRVSGSSTISLRFLSLSDQAVVVGWARLRPAPCLFPIPIPHLLMALTTKISNKLAVRVSSYHLIPLLIASFLQFILLLFKQILRFLCLINDLRVVSQLAKLSSSYLDCLTR